MPSKNSPSKRRKAAQKTRPLRLRVVITAPKSVPTRERVETIIKVVEAGGAYALPDGWSARIEWSNNEGKTTRQGDFSEEMQESARSSRGWDSAVLNYLRRKL